MHRRTVAAAVSLRVVARCGAHRPVMAQCTEGYIGLGGLCPKKALLCYAAMPAGSSIMLNLEAYYARNMPTVCPQGLL